MRTCIDLTHMIEEDMPVMPGDPQPEIKATMTLVEDICAVHLIRFVNHLGTHLDAPSHFIEGGITVDQIPLETLIGKAIILDFTKKGKNDLITIRDFDRYVGRIEAGSRVLMKTGWGRNFNSAIFYKDFPCLTLEAAEYLASTKIGLLGMDTPSPSPLDDPDQGIHKTLLGSGIVLLEAMKNLTLIDRDECDLIALPPPFKNASGAPCRVVAVVEE